MKASWYPKDDVLKSSNIYQMMLRNNFETYEEFWKWSSTEKESFWSQTIENLHIQFDQPYTALLDTSNGVEQASWLKGAKLNIVDSCFQNSDESTALIYQSEEGLIKKSVSWLLKSMSIESQIVLLIKACRQEIVSPLICL